MSEHVLKIMHIDDEPDISYIVEFVLSGGGFEVSMINDPTLAIPELKKDNFALILLDLMMGQLSGFDLLKQIREENELNNLKVLVLSSRQLDTEEIELLKSLGADIMSKPFDPQRLLEKVREIVT